MEPIPDDLWRYYLGMVAALRALDDQFLLVIADPTSPFFRHTRRRFDEALCQLRDELDQQVVLTLVASAEAMIRRDFEARRVGKGKDQVTAQFRLLQLRFDGRVPLEEILDAWKQGASASEEAGALKQMYIRRHWLSHGRYWRDKRSGVQPSPRQAIRVIEYFVAQVRESTPDFPLR